MVWQMEHAGSLTDEYFPMIMYLIKQQRLKIKNFLVVFARSHDSGICVWVEALFWRDSLLSGFPAHWIQHAVGALTDSSLGEGLAVINPAWLEFVNQKPWRLCLSAGDYRRLLGSLGWRKAWSRISFRECLTARRHMYSKRRCWSGFCEDVCKVYTPFGKSQ